MTIPGGVQVTGFIAPTDNTDVYPTHDALYGMDGWRSVADAAERNAIPDKRRRQGMMVAQQDTSENWQLNAGPWSHTDSDWTIVASTPVGPAGGDLAGTYPNPTLAVIGSATGPIGDAVTVPVVTIDAKGRVTALTSASIVGPFPPNGPAGGDLAGTYPNPTLAAIGSATGPIGNATTVPVVTIDAKGRVTALTSASIVGPFPPNGPAGGDLAGTYPNPTLGVIGSATGPIGNATTVPVVTIDAKGRVTALGSSTIVGPFPPNGPAGGDLAGTYPNPTVAQASAAFAMTGVITPSALSGNTNDYSPTGLASATTIRLSATAAFNLTGLTGGSIGRAIVLKNIGSFAITIKAQDTGSSAANRFLFERDLVLAPNNACLLIYDATSSRWRLIGTSAGTVAGSDQQIQFNDNGVMGADPGFVIDKLNGAMRVVGLTLDGGTGFSFDTVSNSSITGNTDDLNVSGNNAVILNCSVNSNLTGIVSTGFSGAIVPLFITNVGTAILKLKHQDSGSSVGNRFNLLGPDLELAPNMGCILIYDPFSTEWHLLASSVPPNVVNLATNVITSNTTLNASHCVVMVDASAGNVTITLPLAASVKVGNAEKFYRICRVDSSSNTVTVQRTVGNTIYTSTSGNTSVTLSDGDSYDFNANSANSFWKMS